MQFVVKRFSIFFGTFSKIYFNFMSENGMDNVRLEYDGLSYF